MSRLLWLTAIYAVLNVTCPSAASFDEEYELSRVIKNRKISSGRLGEYRTAVYSFGGAFHIAVVEIKSLHMQSFWIGVLCHWHYLGRVDERDHIFKRICCRVAHMLSISRLP